MPDTYQWQSCTYRVAIRLRECASDDDISYTGTLQLDIDMDICDAMREQNSSEDKFCTMTVLGGGEVETELELYFNGPPTR
ncbi:MAG: hypothetical protein HYX40_04425 [Sphingobacteriales bacterium]|nr:hypothetical protein [Sphingobacteriales bacterium]